LWLFALSDIPLSERGGRDRRCGNKYQLSPLRDLEKEKLLKEKYSLQDVIVLNSGIFDYEHNLKLIGRLGSLYLQQKISEGTTIGIGWGSSIFQIIDCLPLLPYKDVRVVQVIGALGGKSDPRVDGPDIAALLAGKLSATHKILHAPLYLDSNNTCESLKKQNQIRNTLNLGYQADIVLLGIGSIDLDDISSAYRSKILSAREILRIKECGGVSIFCGTILDQEGKILDYEINSRVMAVDLKKMRSNDALVIGVAAGSKKSNAIESVLKGNWLDVLIADSNAVIALINK